MLARIGGGNKGIGYYLEHGNKQGRDFTRDELDKRVILDGDLSLTESIINSIPDKGQERYLHITLSFYENNIGDDKLSQITQEYKELLMNAYNSDEFNFYAEAHLPKIKNITDNKTGELIERKPHIHIVIPETNLITHNVMNPRGRGELYIKELDAIQEYINNKYQLVSPKDGVRVSDQNHANVLSRCKGDLFQERNSEIKKEILNKIDKENIRAEKEFIALLKDYGEVKYYNKGKGNQYIGVKLAGDQKFTRLKNPLFSKEYINNRSIPLVKPTEKQIKDKINDWVNKTSYEIKHIHPSSEKIRKHYALLNNDEKHNYLNKVINNYEQKYQLQRQNGWKSNIKPRLKFNTRNTLSFPSVGLSRLRERKLVYGLNGRSERRVGNESQLLLFKTEYSNLSTLRRSEVNHDRYVRRLQDRDDGRIAHTPLDTMVREVTSKEQDLPLLNTIRKEIDPNRFLSHLHGRYNIDPFQHSISYAKDDSPRFKTGNRNVNASDFLTKHLNLEWKEAKTILLDIWQQQIEQKPFAQIKSRVRLTQSQASERFQFLNEHKKWLKNEIKQQYREINQSFLREQRQLLTITNKREREIERGFLIFKKLSHQDTVNSIQKTCMTEINGYYNHWQPGGNNMALGDSLRKIIKNPIDGDSISAGDPKVHSIAHRIKTAQTMQDYSKQELSDLVAHKVSPKEIRYLDPKTAETVFSDKGDSIRMSGSVSQDKADVMLRYAKEKYGGVLRLSGSEEFKLSCAMAAAEKGMNVILKPEKYHEVMQNRVQELSAEKNQEHENSLSQATPTQDNQQNIKQNNEQVKTDSLHVETPIVKPEKKIDDLENEKTTENISLAELKAEAEKLIAQHNEAKHKLEEATKNDKPSEEIKALVSGVAIISQRIDVVQDQIIQFELAEKQHSAPEPNSEQERTLEREVDALVDKLSKELNTSKEDVIEAISFAQIKDLKQFDEKMSQPGFIDAVREDCNNINKIREQESQKAREYSQDAGFSQ